MTRMCYLHLKTASANIKKAKNKVFSFKSESTALLYLHK